jgi:hypothetical protein
MALTAWLLTRTPAEAIALAAPGMLFDTFSCIWFAEAFPNIPATAAGLFGGWLLFCNVVPAPRTGPDINPCTLPQSASDLIQPRRS